MTLFKPFRGLRSVPGNAMNVAAPPYDVVNTEEARALARDKPHSFLHISKPEIDLPEGTDPHSDEVYKKGAENLKRLIDDGVLMRDAEPRYYLYRLQMDEHIQTGIVAGASVAAYDENRIRKHEYTRPDKEDDRVRQIDAVDAQTGPVFLTHRADAALKTLVLELCEETPVYDIMTDDEIRHTFWVVEDAIKIAEITQAFDAMLAVYIADGHHRSAAASRVARARAKKNPDHTGEEDYNYFLVVSFPDDEVQIWDYNRVVRDLNGLSAAAFRDKVKDAFDIVQSEEPAKPEKRHHFGMYLDGRWYRLSLKKAPDEGDPVKALDVSLLAEHLLEPVLDITDPRTDPRIDFVGGIRGMKELERRVDSGEMAAAFALYPTSMTELMAVAEAGQVMPPKSTWFEPKLADGLISYPLS